MADHGEKASLPQGGSNEHDEQQDGSLNQHEQSATASSFDFLAAVTAGIPQEGLNLNMGHEGVSNGEGVIIASNDQNTAEEHDVEMVHEQEAGPSQKQELAQDNKAEEGEARAEDEAHSTQVGNSSDSDDDDYDPSKTVTDQFPPPAPDPTPAPASAFADPPVPSYASFSPVLETSLTPAGEPGPADDRRPSLASSEADDFAQALRGKGVSTSTPIASMIAPTTQVDASAAGAESNDEEEYEPSEPFQQQQPLRDDDARNDASDVPSEPPAAAALHTTVASSVSTPAPVPATAATSLSTPANATSTGLLATPSQYGTPSAQQPTTASAPAAAPTASNALPVVTPSQASFRDQSQSAAPTPTPLTKPKGRLPTDTIGLLEDRIAADPKGDIDAWLQLIDEYKSREKLDETREVYERFFKVFPHAAEQWMAYANFESQHNELYRLEQIFNKSLLNVPNVQLWSMYLDYVRRRNPLGSDMGGQARSVITSAYEFALQQVGVDKDSAGIWTDYVQLLRSGPGILGNSSWQDQQKMDALRRAYQRAINVPTGAVMTLWKEYGEFENGLSRLTGKKFLQERSNGYMTARGAYLRLQNITESLHRTDLPRLPPLPGCDGEEAFQQQLAIWRAWIRFEEEDPLALREEDLEAYRARVVYVYKQALMAMRFVPEVYFEAATFCFDNSMDSVGDEFLKQGVEANPESSLLAFKQADRLELTSTDEHDPKKRGSRVREPYDRLLDALYEHLTRAKEREEAEVAEVTEKFAEMKDVAGYLAERKRQAVAERENLDDDYEGGDDNDDDDDDNDDDDDQNRSNDGTATPKIEKMKQAALKAETDAVRQIHARRASEISKVISFAWIALMRSMRRIQGKGKPGENGGSRQVFAEARRRGRITSDVYMASALMEHHCYQDPAATKIFERGSKLFPEDSRFALQYVRHLVDISDLTNARAVFETATRRLAARPELAAQAMPLFRFMHAHESRYGDMVQIAGIEARMRELFPDDPRLERFAERFTADDFDPCTARLIISPAQTRPAREPLSRAASPPPQQQQQQQQFGYGGENARGAAGGMGGSYTDSPKRRHPMGRDGEDDYGGRPRKYARGESPAPRLKGAAGRRVDQNKRQQHGGGGGSGGGGNGGGSRGGGNVPSMVMGMPPSGPAPLPQDIQYLLSIIPPARAYVAARLNAEKMVALLRGLDLGKPGKGGRRW